MSLRSTGAGVASHRSRHRVRLATLWVALGLVGAATVTFGVRKALTDYRSSACVGPPVTVTVAAAPTIAPVLTMLAAQWSAQHPVVEGQCATVAVVAKEPEQVATSLGPDWDRVRYGVAPQVWVPDSSMWLSVAASRPDGAALLPKQTTSIASSPTVVALREPLAKVLGWPQRTLGWQDVIGAFSRPGTWTRAGHPEWESLRVGITDPSRSTAGLASVVTLLGQNLAGSASYEQLAAGLAFTRTLGAVAPDTDVFFAAQASTVSTDPNASIAAFPAMESDAARYDATDPATPLVPVYNAQQPVTADYPYVVLTASWVDPVDRAIAGQFLGQLLTPAAEATIGAARLRTPDRTVTDADALPADSGFPPTVATPRPAPDPGAISAVVAAWADLQRQVNLLAVLDTSGSMSELVPNLGLTRLQLLQQTATTGFGLLTNRTSIGLWDFSVRPGSTSKYRQLVPFGPLTASVGAVPRGQALPAAVAGLRAAGHTPLYDTVYAAFHEMQQHWQPGSTNAVLVITDGINEFQGGLTLTDLLDRLRRQQRPDQPVQVVTIALGTKVDADALQEVAQATGGRTYVVRDVASAIQTLILAFTGRLQ